PEPSQRPLHSEQPHYDRRPSGDVGRPAAGGARRLRRPGARRAPARAGDRRRLRRGRARPPRRGAALPAPRRLRRPRRASGAPPPAGHAWLRGAGGVNPVRLGPNQPPRFYRGGDAIADLRGVSGGNGFQPEDWVGSTTTLWGQPEAGLTHLDDGRTLRDAV